MIRSNLPPSSNRYQLVFDKVTKRYEDRSVVDELTFTVEPGRVTGFLGPNGSGKSTTMKILLDLAAANHGTATIGGHRYRDLPDPAGTVGVVLEPNAFHPGRSGRNHLRIMAQAIGRSADRVDETLVEVGLSPEAARRRVGTYSLGMKQRLSLAGALLADPPVLVLDEPANGLDPQGIRELRDLLRDRAARGNTVLVSSHLLAEVQHLVDDIVVINQGRLMTTDPIASLTQRAAVVRTPDPGRLGEHLAAAGAAVQPDESGALVVTGLDLEQIGEAAHTAGIMLHELSAQADSLEDLFLSLTTTAEPHPIPANTHHVPARTHKESVLS